MKNIIDYVKNEMNTFDDKPFCPVDSLVLSECAYINLIPVASLSENRKPMRLRELLRAENFDMMFFEVRDAEKNRELLFALAASPRFRDIEVNFFVNEIAEEQQKQFAAATFLLNGCAYIAFRGTDTTTVGWKEDFNMAFLSPIPSQEAALSYALGVTKRVRRKIMLGGHSKGGNLAVYSAMMLPPGVQKRIISVFSHDGPGFRDNVFETEEFKRISGRIDKTLPQSSLIGMLLEHQEKYSVVKSSRIGIMQHDPFSWVVNEDEFFVIEKISSGARHANKTLADWLSTLSNEERERFADGLYAILQVSGITSFSEFASDWKSSVPAMLTALTSVDAETKKFIFKAFRALAKMALKNLAPPKLKAEK